MNVQQQIIQGAPLPATVEQLLALRKKPQSLSHQVEQIVRLLWNDDRYRRFADPITNATAVEGATRIDDTIMAIMVREKAAELTGYDEVAASALAKVIQAQNVVLRRFNVSKRQRLHAAMNGGARHEA